MEIKRGVIISGGDIADFFEFKKDDIIICADRGYEFAAAKGIVPFAVIGDFDSTSTLPEAGIKRITHPSEKDETDTLLALMYLEKMGIKEVHIIGALGGERFDHAFANLLLLKYAADRGMEAFVEDEHTRIFLIKDNAVLTDNSKYISVFPVFGDAEGVSIKGTKYPLENGFLTAGDTIGISNEKIAKKAEISLKKGTLMIMEIKKCGDEKNVRI